MFNGGVAGTKCFPGLLGVTSQSGNRCHGLIGAWEMRVARSTKTTTKPAAQGAAPTRTKTGTPALATKAKAAPAPSAPKSATRGKLSAATGPAAATPRVPPPSKGELRAQIEKLEAANAMLKAKSREANRAAKAATQRIAELEADLARLQEEAARPPVVGKPAKPRKAAPRPAVDPGDAVPPGVAVATPEPMDEEAVAARAALDENLPGDS